MADVVQRYHDGLGLEAEEDDCGARIDSSVGNLYARVEPTADGTPLFLCAHMDTVVPEAPIEPVISNGHVRNAAGGILGADNKAAVAVSQRPVSTSLARHCSVRQKRSEFRE